MSATREICAICGHVSRVGFWVPDSMWREVIHVFYRESTICLACFTERADEHLVEWGGVIELYPVSFVAHMGRATNGMMAARLCKERGGAEPDATTLHAMLEEAHRMADAAKENA